MKLKFLLLPALALVSAPMFAATYYVSPEGAGTKDGSSWENAFDVEAFRLQAEKNANGDIYHLAGGVYHPSATIVFTTATGATLLGNEDGERTVFSGDKNGNNNPDNGDMNRLMRFQANTVNDDHNRPVVIKNIDFTCVYTWTDESTTNTGALYVDNSGDVRVENCHFYSNWAQGERGGAPFTANRSTVYFKNCLFHNNSANYRGAAVRLIYSENNIKYNKAYTTFDGCLFRDNTNYHDYGIIFMSHGMQLNIVNTTIINNKSGNNGAAIYINGKSNFANQLNIISSTITNNHITGDTPSGQIASTQAAHIRVVNSIITDGDEKTSAFYFNNTDKAESFDFVSGGWNYIGTIGNGAAQAATPTAEGDPEPTPTPDITEKIVWQSTDTHGAECTFASIFGENKIDENGVIAPIKFVAGADGAQIQEAVKDWNIPAYVNVTVDQLGDERSEGHVPGAYIAPGITTGIDEITIGDNLKVATLGAGIYQIAGAPAVEAYNIAGFKVADSAGDIIDLSGCARGIYILKAGDSTFKIVR